MLPTTSDGLENYQFQYVPELRRSISYEWSNSMIPSEYSLPVAADDRDRKLLSDINSLGWHVINIFEDETGPAFSFSVGFYLSFGAPEVLIMGLKHSIAHHLINLIGLRLKNGKRYREYERASDLAEGFDCTFVSIGLEHYEEYLGYANWFYRSLNQPYPATQLIWPDKQGKFPWEAGYDERFLELQRLLSDLSPEK